MKMVVASCWVDFDGKVDKWCCWPNIGMEISSYSI
jgi:hypothetical protein